MSEPGVTETTEAVARARAGDADAWGELYRGFAPAIFRFCRRALPTREDAEDATMDIFIKLQKNLSQYDETRSFSAWLYRVAANHCWDILRRRKIRQDKETEDVEDCRWNIQTPANWTGSLSRRRAMQCGRLCTSWERAQGWLWCCAITPT
jgi:DNA-directed RNA polymerase specialized sigma24 family protein